jgi:formylglycine-generating enzyme required for sulfatase activity
VEDSVTAGKKKTKAESAGRVPRIEPLPLFSDRPDEAADLMRFGDLSDTLTGMLARAANPTPFVLMVDGRWGAGKTSLMKTVMAALEPAVGRSVLTATGLPPGNTAVALGESEVLRWAPVAVLEAKVGGPWKAYDPASDWPGDGEPSEGQRLAWQRLRWFKDRVCAEDGPKAEDVFASYRPVRRVFFNAWKYRSEKEMFPALAHELLAAMREDGWLARFQAFVQEVAGADWREAVAKVAESVPYGGGALSAVIERPAWLSDIALYDRARPFLQGLTSAWSTSWALTADSRPRRLIEMLRDDVRNVRAHLRGLRGQTEPASTELPGIVAVFVDDLDRCPPEHVREVLKAMNLLVDLEGCAFVLGADRGRVAEALRAAKDGQRERSAYGEQFLGKIVQLHLALPEPREDEIGVYLGRLLEQAAARHTGAAGSQVLECLQRHRDLLVAGAPPNPRRVKEMLNQAVAQLAIVGRSTPEPGWETPLLKYLLVSFQMLPPLRDDRDLLRKLEDLAVAEATDPRAEVRGENAKAASVADIDRREIEELIPDQEDRAVARLMGRDDPRVWGRILAVLRWSAEEGQPPIPVGDWLDRQATPVLPRSVASAPSEVDEDALSEVLAERAEETKRRKERRAEVSPGLRRLVESLFEAAPGESTLQSARVFRDAITDLSLEWSEAVAEALPEVVEPLVGSSDDAGRLARVAQSVLAAALDDPGLARRADTMNFAMAVRDTALDRRVDLERSPSDAVYLFVDLGRSPSDAVDPFVDLFQTAEGDIVRRQLPPEAGAGLAGALAAEPEGDIWGKPVQAVSLSDVLQPVVCTEASALLRKGVEVWLVVPPGPFVAGGLEWDDESPVRVEAVERPILIARDPVTVPEFEQFVGDGYAVEGDPDQVWGPLREASLGVLGDRRQPKNWSEQLDRQRDAEEGHQYPVVGVTWFEAAAFCRWRNLERCKTPDGPYRLPSEAEWEKAARGALGCPWPWGSRWIPELVVCNEEGAPSRRSLAPVGVNLNESLLGVRGMAGNCLEWTSTRWQEPGFGQTVDRSKYHEVGGGTRIAMRGGSFIGDRRIVRCAFRLWNDAWDVYLNRGFRCVRDVSDAP